MTLRIICSSERCCSTLTNPVLPVLVPELMLLRNFGYESSGVLFYSLLQADGVRYVPKRYVPNGKLKN